jgi:hypothetical protein
MRPRPALLAAAGVLAAAVPVGAWSLATADTPPPDPGLPELPSVADQVEGLYDDDGCLVLGRGEVDCSVRADQVDEALSHGPATESRQLQGFVGSHWLGQVTGTGPAVLSDTVDLATAGPFRAQGLARNQGAVLLDTIDVTASLVAADGTELDRVTVTSPVHDVRPGEPVPFTVTADVAATDVDHVEWSAAGGAEGDEAPRALAWTPYWERPAGGDPIDLYLYRDPAGERPYALFGSVAVVGDQTVSDPEVIIAWLDGAGRLVRTLSGPVVGPDGEALDALAGGDIGDVLLTADADPPVDGEALVWVQGS